MKKPKTKTKVKTKVKVFLNSETSENIKKHRFFPYQNEVRKAYFTYSGLFWFFGLLVYIFSLFIIINLSINNQFHISSNIKDINIFCTPILNLVLVTISWCLLLFAPNKIYQSPKHSSVMFYFSFWFLVVSVVLNVQLQLTYADSFLDSSFYNWINFAAMQVLLVLMVLSLFFIQVFFWIMRRKFAFMPSDYEIYQQRSMDKKAKKLRKKQAKAMKTKLKTKSKSSSIS